MYVCRIKIIVQLLIRMQIVKLQSKIKWPFSNLYGLTLLYSSIYILVLYHDQHVPSEKLFCDFISGKCNDNDHGVRRYFGWSTYCIHAVRHIFHMNF